MTAKRTREVVAETVRYCWAHTDDEQEEAMVLWVAEKLANALGETYRLPDGNGLRHVVDGKRQAVYREIVA